MNGIAARAPNEQRRQRLAGLLVTAAIIFALYLPTLPYPFYFDDLTDIVANPSIRIRSLEPAALLSATGETYNVAFRRPIAFYTFALNYYFNGLDPAGFRLVNILIHLATTVLVWLLARRVIAAALHRDPGDGIPFLAALLWAVHPLQTNAVVYIIQREASLSTLLALASFLAYLLGRERRSPAMFTGSAALFLLAAGTKEIAFALPGLILLYEIAFTPEVRRWIAQRRWVVPAALAAGLLLFPLALAVFKGGYEVRPWNWQQRVLTEARVVAHYLSLLAAPLPSRLLFDYSALPISTGLLSPWTTLPAVFLHLALAVIGGALLVRLPIAGFGILGFYLHLLIESTVLPLEIAFEHRLYLPSVFPIVAAAGLLCRWRDAGPRRAALRASLAALAACVLLCAWWTRERLAVWRDPLVFFGDIAAKAPNNHRAHGELGALAHARGDLVLARKHLQRSIDLYPADGDTWMNLGLVEADSGNNQLALELIAKAYRRGFHDPLIFTNIAEIMERLGRLPEAVDYLKRGLDFDRRLTGINAEIGRLYLLMGDPGQARGYLERELELDPGNAEAKRLLEANQAGGIRIESSPSAK